MEKTIKVLIVDDEQQFRATTKKILDKRGFETLVAENGMDAIKMMSQKPDVVILDIKMPEMDGLTALDKIKDLSPDTPVIMLTGHGGPQSAKAARESKAFDFLAKPCSMDLLAVKIRDAYAMCRNRGARTEPIVGEVMVPITVYSTLSEDATASEAVSLLKHSFAAPEATAQLTDPGHLSLLVLDRAGKMQGMLTIEDLLLALLPPYLSAPKPSLADTIVYSPMFWKGVFTLQAASLSKIPIREIMSPPPQAIEYDANLMEAVWMITQNKARWLAVMKKGELAGVLRERDLLFALERALAKNSC
ncbi:MAG: response regulator [Desulfatibacillaceae bacterium]|nr:response regulator [Desulfatibacillaceae bacterium]